ncbi:hypothetical protein NDU88_002674 [Pleurodeles waltl]|uniref:Uncharacterized protein n=1 Tax=Pleurodeles waltl TaxID=8319 RepID=A0AAV7PEQ8_PLEWA|nr:hypothetical protein NDU88_002674 [Pleurodeles waltl]
MARRGGQKKEKTEGWRDRVDGKRGEGTNGRRRDGGVWRRIAGRRRTHRDSRRRNTGRRQSHRGASRLRREKTRRSRPRSRKNVARSSTEFYTGNGEEG